MIPWPAPGVYREDQAIPADACRHCGLIDCACPDAVYQGVIPAHRDTPPPSFTPDTVGGWNGLPASSGVNVGAAGVSHVPAKVGNDAPSGVLA